MIFPCVGKGPKEFALTQSKIDEYTESFPGVAVLFQCRKARQWCIDHPSKQKTHRGMPGFLSGWLGREQDAGSKLPANGQASAARDDPRGNLAVRDRLLRSFEEEEARG
jgi:hypothetical protein